MPKPTDRIRAAGVGLAVAFAAALAAPAPAAAQSAANGTPFEDWTLVCRAEAVNRTSCGLVQRITVQESGAFVAEIGLNLIDIEGETRVLMVLQTPSGMALPVRPGFQVVGTEDIVALDWRTCAGDFCSATRLLSPEEVASLQGGERMIVGYQAISDAEPINFPSSLAGVTAGLRALREE